MIDIRYFYFTILAIFLSLGLGMLLGGSWISNERILAEQQRFANFIETEFSQLRQENQQFKREIKEMEAGIIDNQLFFAEKLPAFFENIFTGQRIGFLLAPELTGKTGLLHKVLSSGGAEAAFFFDDEIQDAGLFSSFIVIGNDASPAGMPRDNVVFWEGNIEDPLHIFRLLWNLKNG